MRPVVSVQKCASYDKELLYKAVKSSVEPLGTLGAFFKKGDRVLLKPNILSSRPPEEGVNTHPEFIRAVARLVREHGGVPVIGDAPGGTVRDIETVYVKSGIKKIADEENIEMVKFEKSTMVGNIPIADEIKKADCVINLPKAKTHNLTIITGAIKNMFGAVPGLTKLEYHLNASNPVDFAKILIQIFESARPELSIMDGIISMEGEGPAAGQLRNSGFIIASDDAVALDSVFCGIIGVEPFDVEMIKFAHEKGLGCGILSMIEVKGEKIENVAQKSFKLPKSSILRKIPSHALRPITKRLKIWTKINYKKCIKCMLCVESCPAKAIIIEDKKPKIIYNKCISCMCCMEICPAKAISIKRSFLAAIFTMNWKF